jgi:hypothetical protein
MGKGYSWGARPSGGETTGLNQAACENLIRLDREIRGLPQLTAQQPQVQQAQIADMTQNQYSWNNAAQQQQVTTPAPVATGGPASCPPGQFWDGRQCRGSVAPGFSNLMNVASMAPATSVASGLTDFTGGGMTAATSFMGGRKKYLVQNL